MRKRLMFGGLALAIIVAGVIALAAFTAQIVNLTAHVEKDIAVEPVICARPSDQNTPCFVDPRGGNLGVTLPQEFYDRIIEVTLSNSFFEQNRFDDLAFDVLWECKNVHEDANNDQANGVLCREDIPDDSICPIDLDGDGKADTVRHCNPLKLDGNLRDHTFINEFLDPNRCLVDDPGVVGTNNPPNTPRPPEKKVQYVATGFLDKADHKCRYELKFFAPPCIGGFNKFTDPHPLTDLKKPIRCHLADKDRDGNPSLRNPQDFDEFADLGDDFKIQVWAHSLQPCGGVLDRCVDADGFATAGDGIPAAAEVKEGDALTSFGLCPAPRVRTYVDMFDQDSSGTWTAGDDLHVEDPALGGDPDAFHDNNALFVDPVILDLNGSLFDGEPVDVDLDGFLGTLPNPPLRYHDTNGNGCWDSGEDIVLDVNNNGVFD